MSLSTDESYITITESDVNFETWLAKPFISEQLRTELKNANVLLLPLEEFRGHKKPMFMAGTDSLLDFLLKNKPDAMNLDICIEDDDYNELRLHDITVVLGIFLATSVVVPVLVNLISDYLKNRIFKDKPPVDEKISFDIHIVEDDGSSRKLTYNGPAKNFDTLVRKNLIASLNNKKNGE